MARKVWLFAVLAAGCTPTSGGPANASADAPEHRAAEGGAARASADRGPVPAAPLITPAPPSGAAAPCTTDADCEISRLDPTSCCRTCELRAAGRTAERAESSRCQARTAQCPEPTCRWGDTKWGAICSAGQCGLQQIRLAPAN